MIRDMRRICRVSPLFATRPTHAKFPFMTLVPWLEDNEGLASLVLSAIAIGAAFYLAHLEHQRAERAERARTREPAEAAILILNSITITLQMAIDAKDNVEFDAKLVSARHLAQRYEGPLGQIAATPVPDAHLILALHNIAAAVRNVSGMTVPHDNEKAARQACQNRLHELEFYRPLLAKHLASANAANP